MGVTVEPDEHLRWILEQVERTAVIECDVASAHGLTVAAEHHARYDLPMWDNAAMDGYALRASDIAGAGESHPVQLTVVGEVAAGSSDDPSLPAGAAVRIMTGAPLPSDADTVVPIEQTTGDHEGDPWAHAAVTVHAALAQGAHVRRRGESTAAGSLMVGPGEVLVAGRLAALTAAGIERVTVYAVPRVAVLTTGAELRPPGAVLERGQISESNSVLITGLLRECGVEVTETRVRGDDIATFRAAIAEVSAHCDVIVTTGGVGPGRHDIVRLALADEPAVRQVRAAVRPGQPQCAGRLASGPFVFGLPGNPVSAAVSFELFVRPAILAMQGRSRTQRLRIPMRAATPWRGKRGRLQVLPVCIEEGSDGVLRCGPAVDPAGVSHAIAGHGAADGYALVGPEWGDIAAGDPVDVILVTP